MATKDAPVSEKTQTTNFASAASVSWYEASARQRIASLLEHQSFEEFVGPAERLTSPHLATFDLPEQFDDGMIVGCGRLAGQAVFVAAQEGRFMGGAFGEVHGAKLTGLLRAAADIGTMPVLILFDTGGVRLQEANAGEVAIAEIMRALFAARTAGVPVIGLIGGRSGCYGGGSLIAGCCSALAISEQGRLSVSGPEVIETNSGVEAFDSRDRALVWRTMGGKHRRLLGSVDLYVDDSVESFRQAALSLMARSYATGMSALTAKQDRLERRIALFGDLADACDIWEAMGVARPSEVAALDYSSFSRLVTSVQDRRHEDQ